MSGQQLLVRFPRVLNDTYDKRQQAPGGDIINRCAGECKRSQLGPAYRNRIGFAQEPETL